MLRVYITCISFIRSSRHFMFYLLASPSCFIWKCSDDSEDGEDDLAGG